MPHKKKAKGQHSPRGHQRGNNMTTAKRRNSGKSQSTWFLLCPLLERGGYAPNLHLPNYSNRCQGSKLSACLSVTLRSIMKKEFLMMNIYHPYALFPQTCDGVACGVDAFIIFPLWSIRIHLMLYWNKSMGSIQYK
jgi:hypothetical protein